MHDLQITQTPIHALKPRDRNARTHTKRQVRQIANSIREFGFNNPVLTDDNGQIIAGHGRVEAAKLLELPTIPTLSLSHLNDAQKRAYVLADNALATKAGWDREILAIELQGLIDLGFNVELTGFEVAEIDLILEESQEAATDTAAVEDKPSPPSSTPAISRPGDLWILGPHRLLCGDARSPDAYAQVLGGTKADLVFTDPPYNVRIDGHVCGLGNVQHREFAMASGEMSEGEFTEFLKLVLGCAVNASRDGAVHYVCMDWRHLLETLTAAKGLYGAFLNVCVWNKTNGGMGSFYRSKHELVLVFKAGTSPHVNNVELGRTGRYRTNVWDYAGVNAFGRDRLNELAMHPTVKPVGLIADAIQDASRRLDTVLDPFCGSGSTVIAAEKTGRHARCIEIDPEYADGAVRRWQLYTGKLAVLDGTTTSFEEIEQQRRIALTATPPGQANEEAVDNGQE